MTRTFVRRGGTLGFIGMYRDILTIPPLSPPSRVYIPRTRRVALLGRTSGSYVELELMAWNPFRLLGIRDTRLDYVGKSNNRP